MGKGLPSASLVGNYLRELENEMKIKKVKGSHNRPGVAQRVPGVLGSQISLHSAREGDEFVSLTHRPPLPPGMFLVLIFTRSCVGPRAMVGRKEIDMSVKIPVTSPGIDPGTFRLVAQRLNHHATPGPNEMKIDPAKRKAVSFTRAT
jgi:hypothetical protein